MILIHFFSLGQSTYFNHRIFLDTDMWNGGLEVIELDDGYLMAGLTGSLNDELWFRCSLVHLNTQGEKTFEKFIGDDQAEYYPRSLIRNYDGNLILAATKRIYTEDWVHDNIMITSLNDNFDTVWAKYIGEKAEPYDSSFIPRCVFEDNKNNLIITGILSYIDQPSQLLIIKSDSNGNLIWSNAFGNSVFFLQGHSIVQTIDDGYVVGGIKYKQGFSYTADPIIYKTDSIGNLMWTKNIGGPYMDYFATVSTTSDGNILAVTCYADSMAGIDDAWRRFNILKLDIEGNILWNRKYGESFYDNYVVNIKSTNDGGYICGGGRFNTESLNLPGILGWLMKLNEEGDSSWYQEYYYLNNSFNDLNYIYDFNQTSDGGYIACGELVDPISPHSQDAWIIKVDSMGCDTPGCATGTWISELFPFGDGQGDDLRVYPNPAHEYIIFQLINFIPIRQITCSQILITNSFGQPIAQIPATSNKTIFDCSHLPSGIYFYQFQTNQKSFSGKFLKTN